jgi:hypothetical protein
MAENTHRSVTDIEEFGLERACTPRRRAYGNIAAVAKRFTGRRSTTGRARTIPPGRKVSRKLSCYVEPAKVVGRCRNYPRVPLCSGLLDRSTGSDLDLQRGPLPRPQQNRSGPLPSATDPEYLQMESLECTRRRRAKPLYVGLLSQPASRVASIGTSRHSSDLRCACTRRQTCPSKGLECLVSRDLE